MITVVICASMAIVAMFILGFTLGYKLGMDAGEERLAEELNDYFKKGVRI